MQDFSHQNDFANDVEDFPAFGPLNSGAGVGRYHVEPPIRSGVGNLYDSGSCYPNPSPVSTLPSSGSLQKTTPASQNLPSSFNTRFYHVQSEHPFSADHQSQWLPRETRGQDLAVDSIASPIKVPLPFNDDLSWASEGQLGFMNAPAANSTFGSVGNMMNTIPGLSGNYLDSLGPLQQDVSFDGSVLEPLQDFNDFPPVFDQPAQFPCPITFKRDTDRIRHEAAVHGINKATHLCHVVGCNKSHGVGYTRKDKLTEHLWKKHAYLGFVKRV